MKNDLAVIDAVEGHLSSAQRQLFSVKESDSDSPIVTENVKFLQPHLSARGPRESKVAICSFLFNWPSSGGGITHTYELIKFLGLAGYDVVHLYAVIPTLGLADARISFRMQICRLSFPILN